MKGVREKKGFPEGAAPALGNKLPCVERPRTGGGSEVEQHKQEGWVKNHWIKTHRSGQD